MKKLERITEECTVIEVARLNELLVKEKIYDAQAFTMDNYYNWMMGSHLNKIKTPYNPKKKYKKYEL